MAGAVLVVFLAGKVDLSVLGSQIIDEVKIIPRRVLRIALYMACVVSLCWALVLLMVSVFTLPLAIFGFGMVFSGLVYKGCRVDLARNILEKPLNQRTIYAEKLFTQLERKYDALGCQIWPSAADEELFRQVKYWRKIMIFSLLLVLLSIIFFLS